MQPVLKFKICFVPLNPRLRLMLLTLFSFAPPSAKVHILFSAPLPQTGDASVCDMFSSASGFAYVQLLPLAVERDGQIAERGSNLVTLSSPVFSPSSFPARVSQAVIAERCWRLRAACGNFLSVPAHTQRRWRFSPEGL